MTSGDTHRRRGRRRRRMARPLRQLRAHPRLIIAVAIAVACYFLLPGRLERAMRMLIAFDVGAVIFITAIWFMMARATQADMRWRAHKTAASSAGPGQAGRNGRAPASWPARPSPLLPRTMPMTGPGPVKPPAASSTGRTGLMRPRPVAGLPVRRDLRTRGTQPAPAHGCRPARPPRAGRTPPDRRA